MRKLAVTVIGIALWVTQAARADRAVIDDDEYVDRIIDSSARLAREHKLISVEQLRRQVKTKGVQVRLQPLSKAKPSPADLCDRLRESTLAVGTYYKCPDCGEWHFNGSAGFMAAEGMLCTCCHVVIGLDAGVTEAYLVAADAFGQVFPVKAVVAADPESDTCLLSIEAPGLKPLPMRTNVRQGERVYCLSHPGGYYFMFTQGMVARLNRRPNEIFDETGHTNGLLTRPILFLNITAEFAPGSSGAPVVDESGNVVGQVASIADAGDPRPGDTNAPPSPSVPVRFCTASEELLRLADPNARKGAPGLLPRPPAKPPAHRLTGRKPPEHASSKIRIGPPSLTPGFSRVALTSSPREPL